MHLARQAHGESDATRQASEAINTPFSFRSTSFEREQNRIANMAAQHAQNGFMIRISLDRHRARAKAREQQPKQSKLHLHFTRRASSGSDTMVGCIRNSIWHNFASLVTRNTKQLGSITNAKTPFDTL
jgi:hypothetical protein